jgi:hypothetical protein
VGSGCSCAPCGGVLVERRWFLHVDAAEPPAPRTGPGSRSQASQTSQTGPTGQTGQPPARSCPAVPWRALAQRPAPIRRYTSLPFPAYLHHPYTPTPTTSRPPHNPRLLLPPLSLCRCALLPCSLSSSSPVSLPNPPFRSLSPPRARPWTVPDLAHFALPALLPAVRLPRPPPPQIATHHPRRPLLSRAAASALSHLPPASTAPSPCLLGSPRRRPCRRRRLRAASATLHLRAVAPSTAARRARAPGRVLFDLALALALVTTKSARRLLASTKGALLPDPCNACAGRTAA